MSKRPLSTTEYYTILRPAETAALVGYSTVHVHRLEKVGLFPKRFKLNARGGEYDAVGHYLGEVVAYLESRAAARVEPKDTAA